MSAFAKRYAVEALSDGGVAVDLWNGNYVRLNATAARICASLAEFDTVDEAISAVARYLSITINEARSAVDSVVRGLDTPGTRREHAGPFQYGPSDDLQRPGYFLSSLAAPRIWISEDGLTLRLANAHGDRTKAELFDSLRAVAPKVLFLQGAVVLHGSASRVRNGVRAICGLSGAGKTTTARAFDDAGTKLFAEDMLVIADVSPLSVCGGGEEVIRAWASETAACLAEDANRLIKTAGLAEARAGSPEAVTEIWFVDSSRRGETGDRIQPRALSQTGSTLALMASLFLGAASTGGWRRFLSLAATIASSIPSFDVSMPSTLDGLRAAARNYTENSAS